MPIVPLYAIGGQQVFNPATLSLTGWWRDYPADDIWTGTASAGTSGNNDLLADLLGPQETLNGHSVLDATNSSVFDFEGTTDTYANAQDFSGWILFNPESQHDSDIISANSGNSFYIYTLGTGLIGVWLNSEAQASTNYEAGVWQLFTWRYRSGGRLQVGINTIPGATGGDSSVSYSGNITLSGNVGLGGNFIGSYSGLIAEIGMSDTVISDTNFTNIITYINDRYGLSL